MYVLLVFKNVYFERLVEYKIGTYSNLMVVVFEEMVESEIGPWNTN